MKILRLALMLFGLTVVLLYGSHSALAQGNSDAADACQHGGWQDWLDADGNPFENQGHCVSYVAQGNDLQLLVPAPYLLIEQVQYGPGGTCQFWVKVYHFTEGPGYRFQTYGAFIPVDTGYTYSESFPNGQVVSGLSWPADGVTYSVYTVATDADGNHVATSTTYEIGCPTAAQ